MNSMVPLNLLPTCFVLAWTPLWTRVRRPGWHTRHMLMSCHAEMDGLTVAISKLNSQLHANCHAIKKKCVECSFKNSRSEFWSKDCRSFVVSPLAARSCVGKNKCLFHKKKCFSASLALAMISSNPLKDRLENRFEVEFMKMIERLENKWAEITQYHFV